jgi:hypothetical protein
MARNPNADDETNDVSHVITTNIVRDLKLVLGSWTGRDACVSWIHRSKSAHAVVSIRLN